MSLTLAFDVYGTLIDTHGVVDQLQDKVGDRARSFSQSWRDKQLEYSFRRGLMQQYENFAICTRDALEYTDALYQTGLSDSQKQELLEIYQALPAYDDVDAGLNRLQDAGVRMYAFSNGTAEAVEGLLSAAGISEYFIDIVSVDEIRTFKPDPGVYQHFLKRAKTAAEKSWLVSSNPFDVLGALASGMQAAWVQRTAEALFDPWGVQPTITISGLDELAARIQVL